MDNQITRKVWLDKLSRPNKTQLEFLDLQKVFIFIFFFLLTKNSIYFLFTLGNISQFH